MVTKLNLNELKKLIKEVINERTPDEDEFDFNFYDEEDQDDELETNDGDETENSETSDDTDDDINLNLDNFELRPQDESLIEQILIKLESDNYSNFSAAILDFFDTKNIEHLSTYNLCNPYKNKDKINNKQELNEVVSNVLKNIFSDQSKLSNYNLNFDQNLDYLNKFIIDLNNKGSFKIRVSRMIYPFNLYGYCVFSLNSNLEINLKNFFIKNKCKNYDQLYQIAKAQVIKKLNSEKRRKNRFK